MSQIKINKSPMCIHCLKRIDICSCELSGLPAMLRKEVKAKPAVKPSTTMCLNKECPARFTCYRFMKKPDTDQYYKDIKPVNSRGCDYFVPVWKK